ncbi:MAG: PorP/SprF family type IX secretion system membrane protein [Saprospiraceae bacterium]|nr:PorP/SprF family type IX secretion system membrane protein [Saprospiraceae bacterium]
MHYRYVILFLSIYAQDLLGQDIHFSQFNYNYHNLSPALTGQFDGDHRVTANYRNQWLSVPVPYMTASLWYDTKWRFTRRPGRVNFGIGMDYDQAGDSRLNLAKLVGSISYSHHFGSKHILTLGANSAVAQRRFNQEKLRWDVQWNGDRFDPTIGSMESFNHVGSFFMDLSAGLGYEFFLTRRTRLMLNGAAFHLNQPNQSFDGAGNVQSKLPIRFAGTMLVSIGLGSFLDLSIGGMHGKQDVYQETVLSSMIRLYLNKTPGQVLNLLVGLNSRLKDAMIPHIGVEYKNWLISGSYDMNTSAFQTATRRRGGPEITVQHIFKGVKSPGVYKKCPIY